VARIGDLIRIVDEQSAATEELARTSTQIAEQVRKTTGHANVAIGACAASEKLIGDQFAVLEGRTVRDYVLHRAKSDHMLWKKRLNEMLAGINELSPAELSPHYSAPLPSRRAFQRFGVTDFRFPRRANMPIRRRRCASVRGGKCLGLIGRVRVFGAPSPASYVTRRGICPSA
jgi:hypothetical protein